MISEESWAFRFSDVHVVVGSMLPSWEKLSIYQSSPFDGWGKLLCSILVELSQEENAGICESPDVKQWWALGSHKSSHILIPYSTMYQFTLNSKLHCLHYCIHYFCNFREFLYAQWVPFKSTWIAVYKLGHQCNWVCNHPWHMTT